MEGTKKFFSNYFEEMIIVLVLAVILFTHYLVPQKLAFLNFYYLPILLAGYICGKRKALLLSIFSVLMVALYSVLYPGVFDAFSRQNFNTYFSIATWGCFLILASIMVGILYEQKEKKIFELREAYIGILEVMSKYLESTDRYTLGHSVRVANMSMDIAKEMGLSPMQIENIRVAGLLHDIGKIDISTKILQKSAELDQEEQQEMDAHAVKGAELVRSVGSILKDVIPIITHHHQYYADRNLNREFSGKVGRDLQIATSIVAVADAYDAIITDRPYRAGKPPWQAVKEIKENAGTQFDPEVVEAFEKVVSVQIEVS